MRSKRSRHVVHSSSDVNNTASCTVDIEVLSGVVGGDDIGVVAFGSVLVVDLAVDPGTPAAGIGLSSPGFLLTLSLHPQSGHVQTHWYPLDPFQDTSWC